MKRRSTIAIVLVFLVAACGGGIGAGGPSTETTSRSSVTSISGPSTPEPSTPEPSTPPDFESVLIGAESSFGMCGGYCITEVGIGGRQLTITYSTHDSEPDHVVTGTLTELGSEQLRAVDAGLAGAVLEETYGCPDCADGGAAWITVQALGGDLRSTYEFGNPPDAIRQADQFVELVVSTLGGCGNDDVVESDPGCVPLTP